MLNLETILTYLTLISIPIGARAELLIRPLTLDQWSALEELFGEHGAVNGFWCMYWRIGSEYRKRPRIENKKAFYKIIEKGPAPGLIAFLEEVPVGWRQLTPRDSLPWLNKTWRLRRIDDSLVWSISCLYVRKGYRKKGITSGLVEAAVAIAKDVARELEAYPLDANETSSASGTGYSSTFIRAGFREVTRHIPPRPIMRHDLKDVSHNIEIIETD